jgi:hypothetical protein
MLKLNASYSKKVPAEGEYTSQSYHCSMEVELSDALEPRQIQAKIHDTFALVRDAVEAELHGGTPKAEAVRPPLRIVEPPAQTGKASNKQIKFILDLAKNRGLGLSEINGRVQKQFRVGSVYELDRKAASALLDDLKAAA